ncbi:MAG TPA: formimidoylglutamate deiminase, partial [Gemmatimonadetes bacterium]|nr:formimidoylglutamate deiminase [Gemmatimonadota bacterium]
SVAAGAQQKSTGRTLLDAAWSGGATASGRRIGSIVKGARADIVILDQNHPALLGLSEDDALDAWIFSGDETPVSDVFTGGNHVVRQGRHVAADNVYDSYAEVARNLAKNM